MLIALILPLLAFAKVVEHIPGLADPLNFTMWAGYVQVSPEPHKRDLFYWATASQRDPAKDPVVLWLTGGPGCSGLEGLLGENGPFHPADDEGNLLFLNPYAWNRITTMIYVESPAGVGFSECQDPADLHTGDAQTTEDLVMFLRGFFEEHPELAGLDFYITGESYGGHYVPNLALALVEAGENGNTPTPNFKGFMVGNAWTDPQADNEGSLFDWYSHSLISDESYEGAVSNCDFTAIGPLYLNVKGTQDNAACEKWLNQAHSEMGAVDIYSLYTPTCRPSDDPQGATLRRILSQKRTPAGVFARNAHRSAEEHERIVGQVYNPCMTNAVNAYVNRADVQAAIYAHPKKWLMCGGVTYNYTDVLTSVLPVWRKLLAYGKLKMLVYSGDCDGIVPTPGTRFWLEQLELPVTKAWRPWYSQNHQVGGYMTEYKGLTFSTVRGAGHMVPYVQPERGWTLFNAFIEGIEP